jgi:hypothetical protein
MAPLNPEVRALPESWCLCRGVVVVAVAVTVLSLLLMVLLVPAKQMCTPV